MYRMRPSDICYIQSDVGRNFQNGMDMLTTFEELVGRRLTADQLGAIEVVPYQGKYFAYDGNRRLLLFKRLERAGLLHEIDVKIKHRNESGVMMKYSTKDGGQSIRVRGSPGFEQEMDQVLRRHGYA